MNRLIAVVLCSLMWGGTAFAGCVGTITASTPTADFVDHGNGTVTHIKTGLMWKRCSEGSSGINCTTGTPTQYTWQGALKAAKSLNESGGFAGFTDWRVPSIKELHFIVENKCVTPSVNAAIFPGTVSSWYWSASPYIGFAGVAWGGYFSVGANGAGFKTTDGYVRLVRGGQ